VAAFVKWASLLEAGITLPLAVRKLSVPRSGSRITSSLLMVGTVGGYVLLEWLSFIHEYKGVPITPWNPGLGLILAFMILFGARFAVVLFAGAVIAEVAVLRSNLPWAVILGIASIITIGYGLVARLARDNLHLDAGLNRLRDVAVLLIGGLLGSLLVAVFICLLLLVDEALDLGDVLVAAGPLLIGDVIGIAVITPLTLRLALHQRPLLDRISPRVVLELLLFVAVVTTTLWVLLVAAGPNGSKLFYLLFLPVVVAAARYGLDGGCVALAITQLGLVGLLHQYGYDASAFTEFQLLMLILSATGLTVGVVVTERQHAFEAMREVEAQLATKEAESAQAARFNLVSGTAAALAHEINQPMTAARALARSAQELLRGPDADLARADTNLTKLITQIDHVGGVVRHMREFLRRGRPHLSTIHVRNLLDGALALAATQLAASNITVALDAADDLPLLQGDPVQLQEVILNLLRNASEAIVGARKPDGRISVMARTLGAPARIEIGVVDNGPGIAVPVRERLFQPLTTSKSDGLGLGLSIAASIIEAHGGHIWLAAAEPGATEFRFTLPLER
jgi:two-component system, LuxR family, sensor kinase FixL